MSIDLEHLIGEPILIATISTLEGVEHYLPTMFDELIQLRRTANRVALIVDLSYATGGLNVFSHLVVGLAQAAKGIKASLAVNPASPTITIFVGSDDITELAAQAIMQEQYGGARAELCPTLTDALALARAKLSA